MERYKRNIDTIFTSETQNNLLNKIIGVIGCGGQGGYICDFLARIGVKEILLWDGDQYDISNLNRQLGCFEYNIGKNKSEELKKYILGINSNIKVKNFNYYCGENPNDTNLLLSCDFIFLAFDNSQNIQQIRNLIRSIIIQGIPAIDCPNNYIGGFISIHTKKDLSLFDIFTETLIKESKLPREHGFSQSYKCAIIAAEAVNSMIQYFDNIPFAPVNSQLNIDIYHHQYSKADKFGIF